MNTATAYARAYFIAICVVVWERLTTYRRPELGIGCDDCFPTLIIRKPRWQKLGEPWFWTEHDRDCPVNRELLR